MSMRGWRLLRKSEYMSDSQATQMRAVNIVPSDEMRAELFSIQERISMPAHPRYRARLAGASWPDYCSPDDLPARGSLRTGARRPLRLTLSNPWARSEERRVGR